MQIEKLTERQAEKLYREHLKRDFPPAELKPFGAMRAMMRAGIYEPLAFYEGGELVAYAWQTVLPGCRNALIDYYAVLPALRGAGRGTAILRALTAYYTPRLDALILECERPAEAPDPATAQRRIAFYLRAGAALAPLESLVFGVYYNILSLPCARLPGDADVERDLKEIYRAMVPEPYYRGNVIFYGA